MSFRLLISTFVSAACVLALAAAACADVEMQIVSAAADGLKWEKTEEGVSFAALVGDRFVEPYMAMVRLPAGLVSPAHMKSFDMFGVVVSGTMVHVISGDASAKEVPLPEGSFYKIPARLAHISKCVSETVCVTFLYQDGKFDFLPSTQ